MDLWDGTLANVTSFRNLTGISYPLCLQGGSVGSLYQSTYDRGLVVDQSGILRYKGTGLVATNLGEITTMIENLLSPAAIEPGDLPVENYQLSQNYPNPFNPTTRIRFTLAEAAPVRITVYDSRGKEVSTLLNQRMNAGTHELSWNGRDRQGQEVGSGVYIYRMESNGFQEAKKMILLQ
ncbi:MAG: T9SS type A sorting domain-containing protein [Calditrichaeota bacterium]|nr:T9SS type A sorting domain-containing protein [Calditrichota bacterium]MCB0306390.1 T9SS type A sorting domain-containing protein [Calditrichota bacterium]MCB0314286.1 T9SS type A sorting domain-containing protein [Calditrichota bacterium]